EPSRFLPSAFIAPVAKRYLSCASNSVLDPSISRKNPPKGLYASILTAVERVSAAHIKGTYIEPKQFNHDNSWRPMSFFFGHLDKVEEEEWKTILQFDGVDQDDGVAEDSEEFLADQSMMSALRERLLASSPIKT
ncbi:hypothetical protein CVT26_014749, partial [Gymnopilus dilepis]